MLVQVRSDKLLVAGPNACLVQVVSQIWQRGGRSLKKPLFVVDRCS